MIQVGSFTARMAVILSSLNLFLACSSLKSESLSVIGRLLRSAQPQSIFLRSLVIYTPAHACKPDPDQTHLPKTGNGDWDSLWDGDEDEECPRLGPTLLPTLTLLQWEYSMTGLFLAISTYPLACWKVQSCNQRSGCSGFLIKSSYTNKPCNVSQNLACDPTYKWEIVRMIRSLKEELISSISTSNVVRADRKEKFTDQCEASEILSLVS
uniref:Uncharacterized protein n=1 Tax=Cucumis melo TaxID=3656 RepID=A0A9I9EIX3_CUCME